MIFFTIVIILFCLLVFWPFVIKYFIKGRPDTILFNFNFKTINNLEKITWFFKIEHYLLTSILIEIPKLKIKFKNFHLNL